MPTFDNEAVLRRAVESWRRFGGDLIELIVVEDGCKDGTAAFLEQESATPWGRTHLRWLHEDNVHELRCTNRGFEAARGSLLAAWQDDMFLQSSWFVPELLATFTSLVLPPGFLDQILRAPDPYGQGIESALALAEAMLQLPGVAGVNLSGGAGPGQELPFAEALAEIGTRLDTRAAVSPAGS